MTVERTRSLPLGALLIGLIGMVALAAGILTVTGLGATLHPALEGTAFGVSLIVVGLALSAIEIGAIIRFARRGKSLGADSTSRK